MSNLRVKIPQKAKPKQLSPLLAWVWLIQPSLYQHRVQGLAGWRISGWQSLQCRTSDVSILVLTRLQGSYCLTLSPIGTLHTAAPSELGIEWELS